MLKKLLSLLVLAALLVTAAACGQPKAHEGKTLVVYFSWSGHTRQMAETIAKETGGDLLVLEPETPYPTEYKPAAEAAKAELDANARPKIKNLPESLDGYGTILVGYPIWAHTAPMIIGTFLESYDFKGKDVYTFSQSSSMDKEHFEKSMDFVKDNIRGGDVHDGLFAKHDDTEAIGKFLKDNGLKK